MLFAYSRKILRPGYGCVDGGFDKNTSGRPLNLAYAVPDAHYTQ